MSGWHRPDVERSTLDHLAQVVGPTSAQQMVDGLIAKGRAQRDGEVEELRARIRNLERPAIEAHRNEIRQSYVELIAQCEQDRDYEGAFVNQCGLRDREAEWKAADATRGGA